ncbi:DUF5906 domain-containing protein [Paracoccus yeei]|uniref:Uncharacterized protein n=1 Tax=Paracoccus yeei TaxID=147645 RepID=A0A5P2QPK3_9RHOB|nr:DUF5906 domain-containing protein [Paracoccus yeei]QEU07964.1 hypothetical protein FOB51_08065 [Paracoccus yeei]
MNTHGKTSNSGEQSKFDFNLAQAWVQALGGGVFNWRFIHDRDKATPAIKRRGTLEQVWQEACQWNAAGYGIFATVNEMDGAGYDAGGRPVAGAHGDTLEHVKAIRAHVVDLDNLNAMANLERAKAHDPAPWFAVQTSPGKAHVYWPVLLGTVDDYRPLQRKLRQWFDGDKAVIDATRVLRVPGFLHQKGEPHLVTCYALLGYDQPILQHTLAQSLAHVNAPEDSGGRHPLGDGELAGPSWEWVLYGLETMPVDGMSHPDFISFTAAYKQAGWTLADPETLKQHWLKWCEKFGAASKGIEYNLKHWDSINDTEVGWKSMLRQNPNLNGAFMFHGSQHVPVAAPATVPTQAHSAVTTWEGGKHPLADQYNGILTAEECAQWFAGCAFISSTSQMFTPFGLMNQTSFNAKYGGKRFIITPQGAPTDEAWKAATRSTLWTVPKIDRLRFKPNERFGEISRDELGRMSLNIYRPAEIETLDDDPAPFLHHLSLVLPDQNDQRILLEYLAHNVKYPGHKIPWAPLIQSTEGIGKGVFKLVMQHAMGHSYTYFPNAKLLNDSGSKFNGWMDQKLFFVADEIRTDEKRDMVEVLKPIISERELEMQGKGKDQVQGDNPGNWLFFSNHKDAIPVNDNSRRFAIFYSPIQSVKDLEARLMDDGYFRWLFDWLGADGDRRGLKIVANYLLHYPIERGAIPMRAPHTSSHAEAVTVSLGPIASAIMDAIEAERPGFRGGWINRNMARDMLKRDYTSQAVAKAITDDLGGYKVGRHSTPIFPEGGGKPELFRIGEWRSVQHYMADQGYFG